MVVTILLALSQGPYSAVRLGNKINDGRSCRLPSSEPFDETSIQIRTDLHCYSMFVVPLFCSEPLVK